MLPLKPINALHFNIKVLLNSTIIMMCPPSYKFLRSINSTKLMCQLTFLTKVLSLTECAWLSEAG